MESAARWGSNESVPSGPRGPARRRREVRDAAATRAALLAAGAELFAARGFEGAAVERIAERARVNKAMISYHFGGKRRFYVAILSEALLELAARLEPLRGSRQAPEAALREFVAGFAEFATRRPYLVPILARELAAGAPNVGADLLPRFLAIFSVLREVLERGARAGAFRRVHPLLTHLTVVGSVLFFFLTGAMRRRLAREGKLPFPDPRLEQYLPHLQELLARGLAAPGRRTARLEKP
jgi:AcrR family transcriptional regulator